MRSWSRRPPYVRFGAPSWTVARPLTAVRERPTAFLGAVLVDSIVLDRCRVAVWRWLNVRLRHFKFPGRDPFRDQAVQK